MTAESGTGIRTISFRDALNEALREEMLGDPAVFLMGENIGERGGSFRVTEGLLSQFGPGRVIDTPLAEATIAGAAVGAAITGMRPVVEILFVDFTTLALDQLVNQAAKYRFLTGFAGRVPMVLRTQGGSGKCLAAQHSQSLEAWFYHVPGLTVVMPSTPHDAKGLLKSSIRSDRPVVFIEHKLLYSTTGPVPEGEYAVEIGRADVKREGKDVTIVAWSNMTLHALDAAGKLAAEGIDAEVVDLRTLSPLDRECVLGSVRKTGRAVVAQEAVRRGGVASDIASIIQEEAFRELQAPVAIVAGRNVPIPYNANLEKACTPCAGDILEAVRKTVGYVRR
jgi:pyruvate dehydrogenase E1 component beta subunit